MIILHTVSQMQQWSRERCSTNNSVGFVPTMGALHRGHSSLIERSSKDNDFTVVSIFINPTQFNQASDFDSYPRTFDQDLETATIAGAHVIFAPSPAEMYPQTFSTMIEPGSTALALEGVFRPGHFRGVVTVVAKLLNAVQPTQAYFGQKDFQQLAVINQLVHDLNIAVTLVGVETVREPDGLALSSRNARLTEQHRRDSVVIFHALTTASDAYRQGERDISSLEEKVHLILTSCSSCLIEYAKIVDADTFNEPSPASSQLVLCIAAWFGEVRLIDNILLS